MMRSAGCRAWISRARAGESASPPISSVRSPGGRRPPRAAPPRRWAPGTRRGRGCEGGGVGQRIIHQHRRPAPAQRARRSPAPTRRSRWCCTPATTRAPPARAARGHRRISANTLQCVTSTPLGPPVEPEVKMTYARFCWIERRSPERARSRGGGDRVRWRSPAPPRSPAGRRARGREDGAGAGRAHHRRQPRGRVARVQRHVRGARLHHPQQRRRPARACASISTPTRASGPIPRADQVVGDAVGAPVQLRVRAPPGPPRPRPARPAWRAPAPRQIRCTQPSARASAPRAHAASVRRSVLRDQRKVDDGAPRIDPRTPAARR